MASADLLLHPVRLRIVKAFLGDRALTSRQLAAELPDVPAASIYRHVARLTEAGVLHVVAERRVRGITERTYTLRLYAAQVQPGEFTAMSPAEHASAFLAFVGGLLGDFDRYVATKPEDPRRDGVGYRLAAMWLTDAELTEYLREFAAISQPRLANAPGNDRRRRMLYNIMLPAPENTSTETAQPPPRRSRTRKKDGQ